MEAKKTYTNSLSKEDLKLINETFDFNSNPAMQKAYQDTPETRITPQEKNKRIKAAQEYLPIVIQRFAEYNCLGIVKDIFLESLTLPSLHMKKFIEDEKDIFIMAQAIWLLDYAQSHSCHKLTRLLEIGYAELYKNPPYDSYDTVHNQSAISAAVDIINRRYDEKKHVMDELLSTIDTETKERLITVFENHIFDFLWKAVSIARQTNISNSYDNDLAINISIPSLFFLEHAPRLMNCNLKEIQADLENNYAAKQLTRYGNGDPYELCAAYLLLSQQDHSLVHMNTLTAAVLAYAKSRLPWNTFSYPVQAKNVEWEKELDKTLFTYTNNENNNLARNQTYEQLLWQCCNLILPRKGCISTELINELCNNGVPENQAHEIAAIAYYHTNRQTMRFARRDLMDLMKIGDFGSDVAEEYAMLKEKSQKTEDKLEYYERKIQQLQQELANIDRLMSRQQKDFEQGIAEFNSSKNELTVLRETIYHLHQSHEHESSPDESIVFPHKCHKRILVYGGHDSWLKNIRDMLPDVKFMGKDIQPRAEAIRNADEIWIQPNALAHKTYYSIIDTVRTNHIPLRYFSYASARKCAEEIVLSDDEK